MVDITAVLILLVAGAFLGELVTGKPTKQVVREAGSAVAFPPVDLVMWLAPPLLLGLVYTLLVSRGVSVGSRLRRGE